MEKRDPQAMLLSHRGLASLDSHRSSEGRRSLEAKTLSTRSTALQEQKAAETLQLKALGNHLVETEQRWE